MTGLILLTLRELRARKVVVGLFVVATVVWIALAFALQLDVVDGSLAGARLFGQEAIEEPIEPGQPLLDEDGNAILDDEGNPRTDGTDLPFNGDTLLESVVFTAQAFVSGAAYWIGILLALFATGGLIASLTERGTADVVLTKPLSRSSVLGGRLLAVMVVMLALLTYLFGAVWLVMSIKTGIWSPRFLLAIPVVFGMFAVVYSVVTLVGVWSGSAPLSLIVTLGLGFVTLVLAVPELPTQINRTWRPIVVGAYHLLPKFGNVGTTMVPQLATGGDVGPLYPLLSSLAFGAACYGLAFVLFSRKDY
ncbi:ABC transporter permease [Rubrivirga marina]|uniref:ABC transporter permease n=1 Tax=Rubrivirga marina TaxID=1196024 RepID=UPI000BA91BAF|nr:ABC transporter permease subunit [Rubrivirga marina]